MATSDFDASSAIATSATATSPYPGGVMKSRHHFSVSAYWFATNLLWAALLMIIVPKQIKLMAPGRYAEMEGWVLGLGAVPGLLVPLLIGPISDRCMARMGRRRPYMLAGVAINLVGLAMIYIAGKDLLLWLYFVGYFVNNAGNNVATGSYAGVIPDVVPQPQRGEASGWMAAMTQLGNIVGALSAGILMGKGMAGASFAVMGVCLVVFLLITVTGIREQPRLEPPEPMHWVDFIKRLWIDPRKYPDFAWVWVTRALVTLGVWMVQPYLQYYLVDVVGVAEKDCELVTSYVVVVILVSATITGLIGGKVSDHTGRKPVVYVANGIIAAAALTFPFMHAMGAVYLVAAIFGLGYGAYTSVDWALGTDVLPNKEDAAKDMAVWHISMVLPQTFAPMCTGVILGIGGKKVLETLEGPVTHYAPVGYMAVFFIAAFFLLLGTVLIRNVRGVR